MKNDLIIAVYLNQRIVFDLIAILQDGMSTVTRISSSEETKKSDTQRYGAAFGLSQALSSLLKIDVSGNREKSREGSTGLQKSEERVHTPSSLFQKLRSILASDNKIEVVTPNTNQNQVIYWNLGPRFVGIPLFKLWTLLISCLKWPLLLTPRPSKVVTRTSRMNLRK